jgi:carbamoyltransferase
VYILGVSCYYHDAAAALLQDGLLIAAAEEERFSWVKHDYGFPRNAIRFCLDQAGLQGKDLDYVVFFEKPFRKFDRILMTTLQTYPQSWKVFRESMISWVVHKLWVGTTLQGELGVSKEKVIFVSITSRMPPAPICVRLSRKLPFSPSMELENGSLPVTAWVVVMTFVC